MIPDQPDFVITEHDGFHVLRDDMVEGGTKSRVLMEILPLIDEPGIVYAAHPYGYGAEALAVACNHHRRMLTLLYPPYKGYPNNFSMPRPMRRATMHPDTTYHVIDGEAEQAALSELAKEYAAKYGYYFMQVGFDDPIFRVKLEEIILRVKGITEFSEVWVTAGSGLLARTLRKILPNAEIIAVNLGMPHCDTGDLRSFMTDLSVDEEARSPPNFPSARYYDAKLWEFVKAHGSPGALVWNVAG